MLHLRAASDPAWVACALADLDRTLVDHAHCELKAASNALSMVARHANDAVLIGALTELAQEEIVHFQRVFAFLTARGVPLGNPPVDPYVTALRRAHLSAGRSALPHAFAGAVDRLLISALIEARSCERFDLLARALDGEIGVFYAELRASEARHYRTYVDLAVRVAEGDDESVLARLDLLAAVEGLIVERRARADVAPAIHG